MCGVIGTGRRWVVDQGVLVNPERNGTEWNGANRTPGKFMHCLMTANVCCNCV